jgi:putative spermidine/putrescine transport system permease protein
VLLIMLGALQGVDISVERAAASLGAGRLYTFRRVIVPMVAPGLVSAAFFSFLTSFDELIISLFLSDVETETLPVRIWNSLIMSMEPIVAAISTFLILVTTMLLLTEALVRRARA